MAASMVRMVGKNLLRNQRLLTHRDQVKNVTPVLKTLQINYYATSPHNKTIRKVLSPSEAGDNVKIPNTTEQSPDPKRVSFSPEEVENLLNQMEADQPLLTMKDPYAPTARRCILCKHNVDINYKNVQLLSQFVSPYTGRIYGRKTTGLCIPMQKRIAQLIKRARNFAFMPHLNKDVEFYDDDKIIGLNNKRNL